MQLGRLHHLAREILLELQKTALRQRVAELYALLQQASASNNADTAKLFDSKRAEIEASAASSRVDRLPTSYQEIADEIGARRFFGAGLSAALQTILSGAGLTPATALARINLFGGEIDQFTATLTAMTNAFEIMRIEEDFLENGTAEIGLLLPRNEEEPEDISQFAKAVKQIDFILRGINEVATNDGQLPKLRSISSSDWQFYIHAAITTVTALNFGLKQLVALMHSLSELKKQIVVFQNLNTPEQVVAPLQAYVQGYMKEETRKIAKELIDKYATDKAERQDRLNELENQVTQGLSLLASKIDAGMRIELRIEVSQQEAIDPESAAEDTSLAQQLNLTNKDVALIVSRGPGQLRLEPPDIDENSDL